MRETRRLVSRSLFVAGLLAASSGVALAHGGGGLRGAAPDRLAVPTWLFLLTGGGAVGASFLLSTFVTERAFLSAVHGWREAVPAPRTALAWAGRAVGLVGFGVVWVAGTFGPPSELRNAAVLVVWVGWWAGFTMFTYLVGNAWPAVNPVRTLAGLLPSSDLDLPARLGTWPATVALLGVVYVEIVSPMGENPRLLAVVVGGYVVVSLAGAAAFGEDWFRRVDPVARVFRTYGRMAPVQRTDGRLALRLPGSALTDRPTPDRGGVAFVVALLWGTTFDGLISTAEWRAGAIAAARAGLPPWLIYLLGLVAGFAAFLAAFRLATRLARRTAPTFRESDDLARRFAPSLVPIAAGYHLAHYLLYFVALLPALFGALASPVSPPADPQVLVVPAWTGGLPLAFVLLGHLLAIWVAHAVAFETFPGRLQAIRSQYPLTAAMVAYTMTSLWILSQPSVDPPFL